MIKVPIFLVLAAAVSGAGSEINDPLGDIWVTPITAERMGQLKSLFPNAAFRQNPVQLTDEQVRMVKNMTGAQVLKRAVSLYEARIGERVIAYVSFFDARESSGVPCKVAVSVSPDGRIYKVVPFPGSTRDPISAPRFLKQFAGKRAGAESDWKIGSSVVIPVESGDQLRPIVAGVRALAAVLIASKSLGAASPLGGTP